MWQPCFWGGVQASPALSRRQVASGRDRAASQQLGLVRCVPAFVGGFELPVRAWNDVLEILFGYLCPFSICCDVCSVTRVIIGKMKHQNRMPEWLCVLT